MGKVIFRLPSKGIQYGYAEYSYDDDGDAYQIGLRYREFVTDFLKGEADGQKLESDTRTFQRKAEAVAKVNRALGVPEESDEDVMDAAVKLLEEGLGASVYDEPVDQEAAPWEAPPPAPSDDDWVF